jgi:hypothetical protein
MQTAYKSIKYFSFKLDDWERKTQAGRNILEAIKREIPKEHRFYFPEIQSWMIEHSEKVKFLDLLSDFVCEITQIRQEEIF